jgi:hypothetical protein
MKKNLFTLCAVLLLSCYVFYYFYSGNSNRVEFVDGYPLKPEGPAYLNNTELKFLDQIGIFELKRGSAHVNSELALVLLDRLPENITIEEYAVELFKRWDIGRKVSGRGILYLLVQDPGLLKIETGYALEGVFPDAFINSYQDSVKLFFQNNQLGDAISQLILEMIQRVKDPNYTMEVFSPAEVDQKFLSGGAGISGKGYAVSRIEKDLNTLNMDSSLLEKYGPARTPEEAVQTYLRSMQDGISSPLLGILTEGSRYMNIEYPRTKSRLQKDAANYERSGPYKIYQNGKFAFVSFAKRFCRPILLRQDELGYWLVDQTKMWAFIDGWISDEGALYYVQTFNNLSPWSFAVNLPGNTLMKGLEITRPEPFPLNKNLQSRLQKLEYEISEKPSAASYFELADLYFFENYWIKDAIKMVAAGLELDPYNETLSSASNIFLALKCRTTAIRQSILKGS